MRRVIMMNECISLTETIWLGTRYPWDTAVDRLVYQITTLNLL